MIARSIHKKEPKKTMYIAITAYLSLCPIDGHADMSLLRPAASLNHQPGTALLLHRALDEQEQLDLYRKLCAGACGTSEWSRLMSTESQPNDRPWPLCVWRHPFTEETNSALDMSSVFDLAGHLAERAAGLLRAVSEASDDERELLAKMLDTVEYDSLLSLVYPADGRMVPHVDHGLNGLGLAVSLGAACTFSYGGTDVVLRSGDALFGQFGAVSHEVSCTHSLDSAPTWWHGMSSEGGEGPSHFGRVRCTIQIRSLRHRDEGIARAVVDQLGNQLGRKIRRRETV